MTGKVLPLHGPFPERKPDQIVSWDNSPLFSNYKVPRYNPDELVSRRGLAVYRRMLNDEQVKAVTTFKRDAVMARGWHLGYAASSQLSEEEQTRRINVINVILKMLRGSFYDALNTIWLGRVLGFSMTEKVYGTVEIQGKDYVGINLLVGRQPEAFEFYTNDYGVLIKVMQKVAGREQIIDMTRFIHYVHQPEHDRFLGRSDLREAYRPWYIKDAVTTMWPMYLEKFGGGFLVAKRLPGQTMSPSEIDALQDAMSDTRSLSSLILPPGIEMDVHFPATTDGFEKCITFHDLGIAKALLVPNLLGVSHTGQTGAFAQSQTQMESFFWTLQADQQRMQACIDEQLIRDLGDQNFGDGEYPCFLFRPPSEGFVKWMIETWQKLSEAGDVMATEEDEAHIREILGMPQRDPDAPLLMEQKLKLEKKYEPEPATPPGGAQPSGDYVREVVGKLETIATALLTGKGAVGQRDPGPDQSKAAAFSRALGRVNFSVIDRTMERWVGEVTPELARVMARAVTRALGTPEELAALLTNVEGLAALALHGSDISKVKARFLKALQEAWRFGQATAINEVERARAERFTKDSFASLRDVAQDFFEANSFRMAGNLSDAVRAIIQQEMQQAIKAGLSVDQVRDNIWARLSSRGFLTEEALREQQLDDAALGRIRDQLEGQLTPSYLATLVRTNTLEAFNEARYALFTDPDLGQFVRALEYSAILDDRTTEICRALDGNVWAADNPIWDSHRPPNHYNCRSIVIAITAVDDWDGRESMPPAVGPQAGFGA
jgi:SPP1 gp7 family putative phage head morphogenesis protein